jgi:GntR family transcriptional repressor for pyruvate dehydrogenase complex
VNDVTYLELWEAMMAIEPAAAQYAATRRTAAQLQAIVRASTHFRRDAAETAAAVVRRARFFQRGGGGERQPGARPGAGAPQRPARPRAHRNHRARAAGPSAHRRGAEPHRNAVKREQSELARTWMEKHIRDFKRGYELAFPTPGNPRLSATVEALA